MNLRAKKAAIIGLIMISFIFLFSASFAWAEGASKTPPAGEKHATMTDGGSLDTTSEAVKVDGGSIETAEAPAKKPVTKKEKPATGGKTSSPVTTTTTYKTSDGKVKPLTSEFINAKDLNLNEQKIDARKNSGWSQTKVDAVQSWKIDQNTQSISSVKSDFETFKSDFDKKVGDTDVVKLKADFDRQIGDTNVIQLAKDSKINRQVLIAFAEKQGYKTVVDIDPKTGELTSVNFVKIGSSTTTPTATATSTPTEIETPTVEVEKTEKGEEKAPASVKQSVLKPAKGGWWPPPTWFWWVLGAIALGVILYFYGGHVLSFIAGLFNKGTDVLDNVVLPDNDNGDTST